MVFTSPASSEGLRAGEITAGGIEWLRKNKNKSFFLFLHYWDAHFPYSPPSGYNKYNYSNESFYVDKMYSQPGLSAKRQQNSKCDIRCDIAKYDAEISYVDEQIAVLLKELDDAGLSNKTIVIITSDHGECFGEHKMSDFGYANNSPCLFHTYTLYDEEVHVPLIFRGPNIPASSRIEEIVELIDIMPTLLDMLDISTNVTYPLDGKSLLPLMEGNGSPNYAISQLYVRQNATTRSIGNITFSIRTDKWKFVRMKPRTVDLAKRIAIQSKGETEEEEYDSEEESGIFKMLFDLEKDSGERENVFRKKNETAEVLEEILFGRVKNFRVDVRYVEETEIDKETEELLKSLGYVTG